MATWHLAKRVSSRIRGFIITTSYKTAETVRFLNEEVEGCPELRVFRNDNPQPDELYFTDPDQCCQNLKLEPTRWAIEVIGVE